MLRYMLIRRMRTVSTLSSQGVNVSEDGALTFDKRTAESVHLDHHAWYIDPLNPDRMLDGNDGGMGISYDKGATWRHIENLPLGQFYHISVDNELPYNIYGGLQDNGSWRGPAYTWYNGPIINEMFEFLMGATALTPCLFRATAATVMHSRREDRCAGLMS